MLAVAMEQRRQELCKLGCLALLLLGDSHYLAMTARQSGVFAPN